MSKCEEYYSSYDYTVGIGLIYDKLLNHYGPQHWWPADTPFEVIVGAILTQAVSWSHVEKAINNLKQEAMLDPDSLREVDQDKLASLIKPSGYYNMKAKKIKAFLSFLFDHYDGDLIKMFDTELMVLRKELLGIYGIGQETADSILLYAGNYPIFVIDAYTKRLFHRLGYFDKDIKYKELQKKVSNNIITSLKIYQEYHALIVKLGKECCFKTNPDCSNCPLS